MKTKILIMFPYGGYQARDDREMMFWNLIEQLRQINSNNKPLVIVNQDTKRRWKADAFLNHGAREDLVDTLLVWSVDSCQMWLAGWGKVIDDNDNINLNDEEKIQRIIQFPGDIDKVSNEKIFFDNLQRFCQVDFYLLGNLHWDLVIGDFQSVKGKPFSGKNLIDSYGTLPLLANWFPELSQAILNLPLYKPRSEFLNMSVEFLKEMLGHRKFAYEQTLNMLIHSWDFQTNNWGKNIRAYDFGELEDDSGFRHYQGCLDQIERTERMLKLLWREKQNLPATPSQKQFRDFINEYDMLVNRSEAICETARVTIRSLLGL